MKTYINIAVSSLFAVLLAYALVISPAFALEVSDNENTAVPSIRDNGDTSSSPASSPASRDNGDTSAPSTQDNGTTADRNAPGTRDNGNTSAPSTSDNGNTSGNPTTPDNNNNRGGGGGGSRRNSGTPALVTLANCSYINSFMKMGNVNDSLEVTKLQNFLKNTEKLDVDVNGIFDQKTSDAVKAFQSKYSNDILTPWGVTTPTGSVFYTTQKKVNEIFCKANFPLTAYQLSQIEAYKNGVGQNDSTVGVGSDKGADTIDNPSVEVGKDTKDNSQTASAFETSIAGKVWKFVKWLFGY